MAAACGGGEEASTTPRVVPVEPGDDAATDGEGSEPDAPTAEPAGDDAAASDDDDGGDATAAPTDDTGSAEAPTPEPAPTTYVAPTPPPAAPSVEIPGELSLALTPVFQMSKPIAMAVRAGSPTLYVASLDGFVVAVDVEGDAATVVSDEVIDIGDRISDASEQGLLGMVFSPDGSRLYLNYTDAAGDTVVAEWMMDGERVDPASERTVLTVDQPDTNHNAGDITFGPDGYLWITMGDGGGGGDPGGNGQNTNTLLGSILRVDPLGGEPYAIPADNPFADRGGRGEIFLYGARNPWRISFDRSTGDLWIADVGQGVSEEITVLYASDDLNPGGNLGWNVIEGTVPFASSSPPTGHVPPIYTYGREDGCSITGGYVYRGAAIPELQGMYLFADYCTSRVWGLASTESQGLLGRFETGLALGEFGATSFGQGADGEVYVLDLLGTVHRIDPA